MMRATEVIAAMDAERRAVAARLLAADGSEADQLRAAMRAPTVSDRLRRLCTTSLTREDLALLCANPFDPVAPDEIADAGAFVRIGLLCERDGEYHVNIDMALTAVPDLPLEFGFAATLLARLSPQDLATVGRAMEVGPRPSRVEHLLDLAEACRDESKLMRHVARLRDQDRDPVLVALTQGELPDDIGGVSLDLAPPIVTIETGEAGQRGLLFRVAQPDVGLDARPVVALELTELLIDLLGRVPPAPDTVAAPAPRRRRRTTSYTRPAPVVEDDTPEPPPEETLRPGVRRPPPRNPFARTPDTSAGQRSVTAIAASAVVDLEELRYAEAALRDKELSPAILEVIAENLVVLREGVDVTEWVERCVLRLGFH